MKKLVVLAMVAVLGVSLLVLAGCGGQTKEAQDQVKVADSAWDALNKELTAVGDQANKMLAGAMTGDISAVQQVLAQDPQALEKMMQQLDSAIKQIPGVAAEYEKITKLTGVQNYVDYANAMMAALDVQLLVSNAGKALIVKVVPALEAGDMEALTAAVQGAVTDISKIQSLQKQADEALKKAEKIKTDKNLGQ